MSSYSHVGNIKAVLVLDKEGAALISKYYNTDISLGARREFEQRVFKKTQKMTDNS